MSKFGSIGLGTLACLALSAAAEAGAATNAAIKSVGVVPENRDATTDDGEAMAIAGNEAILTQKEAYNLLDRAFSNFSTPDQGLVESLLEDLANKVRESQAHYNTVRRLPKGTTMKGGANRGDLLQRVSGREKMSEINSRIKKTMDAYRISPRRAK